MAACMDGLAQLITDADLADNVYAWPAENVTVPCAVVSYPTDITFDLTFGRGADQATFPCYFMVGNSSDKSSRGALSAILAGVNSVKSALDGAHAFGSVRVTDCKVQEVVVGAVTYLSAVFDVEVVT